MKCRWIVFFRYWYIPVANKSTWTDPGPGIGASTLRQAKTQRFAFLRSEGAKPNELYKRMSQKRLRAQRRCCEWKALKDMFWKYPPNKIDQKLSSTVFQERMSQICENYHEKHANFDVCLLKKIGLGGILGLSFPVTSSFGLKPPGSVHQGWFLVPKLINGNFLQEISLFPPPSNPLPFVLCAKCAWYICGARPSNKGGKLVLWRRCLVTWEHLPRIGGDSKTTQQLFVIFP